MNINAVKLSLRQVTGGVAELDENLSREFSKKRVIGNDLNA